MIHFSNNKTHTVITLATSISLVVCLAALTVSTQSVQAESLFRANASYQIDAPYTPPSLFTQPSPKHVGDLVTITINEVSNLTTDAELKVTRNQAIQENGTSLFNGMTAFLLDKLPFNTTKTQNALAAPSFDGMVNSNNLSSKAESDRSTTLTDNITCQVVQVLPNGHLLIQGRKVVSINKDRQDMYVTGIINPFYLDRNNTITSTQVANFQIVQGGKGTVSRQQGDSMANKIYQFFN